MIDFSSLLTEAGFTQFIVGLGPWGPIAIVLAQVLACILAPIPNGIITIVSGRLYGTLWGSVYATVGAVIGAAVTFLISRLFGRKLVERFVAKKDLDELEAQFGDNFWKIVVLARLMPNLSFDVVSYGAGITKMKLQDFLLATLAGMIPAALFYAFIGENTTFLKISDFLLILCGLFVVMIAWGYYKKRQENKKKQGKK